MKKISWLIIICFFLFKDNTVVLAKDLICVNNTNNSTTKIFYNFDEIKFEDKIFEDIFVFGNGISGEYIKYKSIFLGIGKKLDKKWQIDLEFRDPTTANISIFKYSEDKAELISETLYYCE
tara:strand:- start:40 stop:402 length:363 start_codon:yes stop_codon:yes gene_type:complete